MTAKILVETPGGDVLIEAYTAEGNRLATSETPVFPPAVPQGGYQPAPMIAMTYETVLELFKLTEDGTRVKVAALKEWTSWRRADEA
jgi:hypothetical protein